MKNKQTNYLPGIFDIQPTVKQNHLFYGDNLTIMRTMPPMSVDLIYLDPPFNSQRNYNLIYKKLTGQPVPEQEEAFCDAWEMDAEKEEMVRNMRVEFEKYAVDDDIVEFWQTWITALRNTQPRLLAYLVYMSYRLLEMRRILKPTGSIYLHCDSTASHYIKVIMDGIFGHSNFRNEIIWHRYKRPKGSQHKSRRFGWSTDTILFYTKSDKYQFYPERVRKPVSEEEMIERNTHSDERGPYYSGPLLRSASMGPRPNLVYEYKGFTPGPEGWRMTKNKLEELDARGDMFWTASGIPRRKVRPQENPSNQIDNLWNDIDAIGSQAQERLGYPTQKPIALLERIIKVSSNEGDVVFDPFAGCGTAIYASHLLGRKWIGCDIAILSVKLARDVLFKRYGLKENEHYQITGVPLSVEGAEDLFARDPRQFQNWAIELAGGFSSIKHSGDLGIDGRIHFETQAGLKNMVLSVKGGKLTPAFMRELRGVLEREGKSEIGGLICLQEPTKGMLSEAAAAGIYTYQGTDYHRLQIRTIGDLLEGRGFDTPSRVQTLNWIKQLALPL
jgi:site-specific DNA-methyltransferase (adenine-specific)